MTVKKRPTDDPAFDRVWALYPHRPNNSKIAARKAWDARLAEGITTEAMESGLRRYVAYLQAEGTEPRFIKQAATFFGPAHHFLSDFHSDNNDHGERGNGRLQLLQFYQQEPLV